MRSNESPKMRLATARAHVAQVAPYYTTLLYGMSYVQVATVAGMDDTMGATDRGHILYTVKGVQKWSELELAGVLEHEIMHVMFDDAATTHVMGLDPRLANIAQDIRINGILLRAGRTLPKTSWYPENPDFGSWTDDNGVEHPGMPPGLTWLEIYERLKQMQREGTFPEVDRDVFGMCGSAAGNPVPEEEDIPGSSVGRSSEELQAVRVEVAEAIRQAATNEKTNGAGSVPDELKIWADIQLSPPVVPWKTKLSRRHRRANALASGMVEYAYDRPSRRQASIGYGRGRPILPRLRAPVVDLMIATDTSASMRGSDYDETFSEMVGILRSISPGQRVLFAPIDAGVHGVYDIRHWRDALKNLQGGGGTVFQPLFDLLANMKPADRPKLLTVFTDGGLWDRPRLLTPDVHVIWCVTSGGPTDFADFGEFIRVGPQADAR